MPSCLSLTIFTQMLTGEQVAAHITHDSLWMIIAGNAYDLTEFAPSHPGGLKILLKFAGKDATSEYDPIHPPGTIESSLPPEKHLGPVDMTTVQAVKEEEHEVSRSRAPPTLAECLNLVDIENAAEVLLRPKAWAYYASAADDEKTKQWNSTSFDLIRFRPRVLKDVSGAVDMSIKMLGHESALPFFIAPAAMGRLAHPEGERCLARVAAGARFPYIVSANASLAFEELALEAGPDALLFYQLYVNRNRQKTEEQLRRVVKAGYKGICVTVDAPVAGKRERRAHDPSMRDASNPSGEAPSLASVMFSYVDASLNWSDLAWIKRVTGLPLMVKGIQCAEDAALCVEHGVDAIYLSNHGGRQLEGAPSSLETLLEIRKHEPKVLSRCEVYVDGGVKRGTDILKALALGATAVGVGRPFMCSLTFGDVGVAKVTQILREEITQNLRLLGVTRTSDLRPSMLNTRQLEAQSYVGEYISPVTIVKSRL